MIHIESYIEFPTRADLNQDDTLKLRSGQYVIDSKLGEGGFAKVYKITNQNNQSYALKFMDLTLRVPDEYDSLKAKFQGEFRVGGFKSNYLVKNHFIGMINGNPYIIMELCPNGNLVTNRHRYNSEDDYNRLSLDILSGLQDLHRNGVIHRDIKPENILFSKDTKLKLADFGISGFIDNRLTIPGLFGKVSEVYGSVEYCPNESLDLKKSFKYTKPTMDIYSFGITIYYVLSGGQLPFKINESSREELERIKKLKKQEDYIPLFSLNKNLQNKWYTLIEKCLRNKPEDRFQSIEEVIEHLELNDIRDTQTDIEGEYLVIMRGEKEGMMYNLLEISSELSRLHIGRSPSGVLNHIPIHETATTYVSSRHATLEHLNGSWYIRDGQYVSDNGHSYWKQSMNKTIINYYTILEDKRAVKINDGDIIQMGDVVVKTILNRKS